MIALFVLIALTQATSPYEALLKKGQRRFVSSDFRKGINEVEEITYDITFVENYHSLDHDSTIEDVKCTKDTITIYTNKPIHSWKQGDVFTGNSQWGCEEGISRKVKSFTYVKQENNNWIYEISTSNAEMEDIFVSASIEFKLPDEEHATVRSAVREATTYSKTFSFAKTYTIVDKRAFTSELSGTVDIPVTINGLSVTVDANKNTKTYAMSVYSGMTYDLKWTNSIKKSTAGTVEKKLYEHPTVTIPLMIGPIEISIKLKPVLRSKVEYSFNGEATAVLGYKKTYEASIVFNSEANPIIKASASDKTEGALPTLTTKTNLEGTCIPEVMIDLEMKANVYGINVLSAKPTLRGRIDGRLASRKITITPSLIFDYSCGLLIWNTSGSYTIATGKTHTVSF